jgi:hypothetical protein
LHNFKKKDKKEVYSVGICFKLLKIKRLTALVRAQEGEQVRENLTRNSRVFLCVLVLY